jgi:hypothetical protein
VALTLIVSGLLLVGRSATSIVIDDGCHPNIVIKKGAPKHLSGPKIAENMSKLVLNEEGNGIKDLEPSTAKVTYVQYESFHMHIY